jgi:DNA-binding NarL/FixJ family response regulator
MTKNRAIKILLVDPDPIFRLGLRVALESETNLEIVGEAQTDVEALQIVSLMHPNPDTLNLVILDLENYYLISQLCRQLKAQYSSLPILLLSSQLQQKLATTVQIGVEGYCPKGIPIPELLAAIDTVTTGGVYWNPSLSPLLPPPTFTNRATQFISNLRQSGNNYIQANLKQIKTELEIPGIPTLERAVLAGKVRELLAARWLLNHLLSASPRQEQIKTFSSASKLSNFTVLPNSSQDEVAPTERLPLFSPRSLQSDLFTSCISQFQLPLQNVTDIALEIDILRVEKKRELLYLILQKLAEVLDELRSSQVEIHQISELKHTILRDLWQTVTTEFFGKFARVNIGENTIEIVSVLLQDVDVVQAEILNYIPLFSDFLSYLIFQNDWYIDNAIYSADSTEARANALMILENIIIQIANSVVQPLLNRLADVESIKKDYYDRQFISTREIERFRNNLSWKYRLRNYYSEPQAIFESRYEIFVFAPRGIAKTSIYASRRNELLKLKGIPLFVTLTLEFRDAVAPRVQSLLSFVGSGVVFVLTQVIGRGLGLIGRGILQGVGSVSFLEGKNRKP